jgi:hypothetical protein
VTACGARGDPDRHGRELERLRETWLAVPAHLTDDGAGGAFRKIRG